MLRGMGFHKNTPIYLAAGVIYKGEESMEPLRRMFPYIHSKDTLLSSEEHKQFEVDQFCTSHIVLVEDIINALNAAYGCRDHCTL